MEIHMGKMKTFNWCIVFYCFVLISCGGNSNELTEFSGTNNMEPRNANDTGKQKLSEGIYRLSSVVAADMAGNGLLIEVTGVLDVDIKYKNNSTYEIRISGVGIIGIEMIECANRIGLVMLNEDGYVTDGEIIAENCGDQKIVGVTGVKAMNTKWSMKLGNLIQESEVEIDGISVNIRYLYRPLEVGSEKDMCETFINTVCYKDFTCFFSDFRSCWQYYATQKYDCEDTIPMQPPVDWDFQRDCINNVISIKCDVYEEMEMFPNECVPAISTFHR